MDNAWKQGYEAYLDDRSILDNPYANSDRIAELSWREGWLTAESDHNSMDMRVANHIDGYDRDDLGYSGDY